MSLETSLKDFFTALNLDFDEQDRIHDLVRKHGGVNWKDALGNSQIVSKLQLTEELAKWLLPNHWVLVVGGWIGLIPYLMGLKQLSCKGVVNIEIDQVALEASDALNENVLFSYERIYENALEINYSRWTSFILVNTSCEHFDNYDDWIRPVPKGTLCLLQSNNMFGLDQHVNCHHSLADFKMASGLTQFLTESEIDIGDGFKRFMIVGYK